ncbi:MAG: hypothetical protein SGARI_007848, partial [Bacillariaceae sp.]
MTELDDSPTSPRLKLPEDLGKLLLSSSSAASVSLSSLVYVNPKVSVDDSTSSVVRHGRGLVAIAASSDNNENDGTIRAGDVLFVTPPTVEAPLDAVLRVYQGKVQSGATLEDIAETILLKEMKRCLRRSSSSNDAAAAKAASFMALQDHHQDDDFLPPPSIDILN